MINVIIIDDEKNALIALKNDLQMYCPDVSIQAMFTKAADALGYLKSNSPQIIFLDIDMPVMNGFDFVNALTHPVGFHIIFVSAYNEFAVRAFKVNALDYLLKPINPAELQAAVQKAIDKNATSDDWAGRIRNFIDKGFGDGLSEKIALPVNDGYNLIDPAHIIYCKAAGSYTKIVMDNENSFLISKTLGRTQELMPSVNFERVHQSYLVNLKHVKKFRKGESPTAVMANDDIIKVSRLNKDRIAQLLGIK